MLTNQQTNNYPISQFHTYAHKSRSKNKTTQQSAGQDPYTVNSHKNYCTCYVRPFQQDYPKKQLFQCLHCQENLQKVAQYKKANIILEYNNAKLQQELEEQTRQNNNLKQKLQQKITSTLFQPTKYSTIKQDLEAQLFECKLINQLLMIGQYPQFNEDTRNKLEDAMIQKLVLQEQLEQKTRIINDTVLYPIYHYDGRVKFLRDCVGFLCKKLFKECRKLEEINKMLKKQVDLLRNTMKTEINLIYNKLTINTEKQNRNTQNTIISSKFHQILTQPQKIQKTLQKDTPNSTNLEQRVSKNSKSKTKPKKDKVKKNQAPTPEIKQQKFLRPCCKIAKHIL